MKKRSSKGPMKDPDDPVALRRRIGKLENSIQQLNAQIDQLKVADNDLKKERNLLRTLIDTMPDYIFIKDTKSRFIINNKAHLEVLGAKNQSDVVGKTDMDIFPPDLAARYLSDEQLVLQIGKSVVNREEPVKMRDGSLKWLSTTKVAVRNPDGTIGALVGISRDITERKQFEEALQKAKDELEIRVSERTSDLKTANDRLAEGLSQLNFLNKTSYMLSQFLRIDELAPQIIKSFTSRFPEAEAALFVRNQGAFDVLGATDGFSDPQVGSSARLALGALDERGLQRSMIINDWWQDARIASLHWPGMEHLVCYVTIPLLVDKKCIAIVQLFTTAQFSGQYEDELPVLNTLAAHAAACLSNALNFHELEKSARQQGELNAARTIQQRFSVFKTPSIPRLRLHSVYLPAYEVGGDYLDCFQTEKEDWVVVIADVCGKGMPAALFMIMLRSAFRMLGRSARSAKELMCAVNEEMSVNLSEKMFVTVLCLIIKKDGTSMTCARAGHPQIMWQPCVGRKPEFAASRGLAMGFISEPDLFYQSLEEVLIPLETGNRFLIYTDGLTDANDPKMNLFGSKRLTALLAGDTSSSPEMLIKKIIKEIADFQQDRPAGDDLTILAMDVVD
jgi:PAS domain S-box-containing protein